jgi:DNA mismatch repair protein MutS
MGIVDKIFTRVGASDNISTGESTFMVEMNETASILNNLSDRSLVLLDEIGRGTSTYDGLSLAWAGLQYLVETARSRTLFATHYHELTALTEQHPVIANMHAAVTHEDGDRVRFLFKMVPGPAEKSFGIWVARMAGVPEEVWKNAEKKLASLETGASAPATGKDKEPAKGLRTAVRSRPVSLKKASLSEQGLGPLFGTPPSS